MVGDEDVLKHKHAVETCGLVSIAVIDFGHKICALDFGAFHRSKSGKKRASDERSPRCCCLFPISQWWAVSTARLDASENPTIVVSERRSPI